ncbi:hypothetical protein FHU31_005204 [Mycolicibacterium fluoranthenivorans]|uniref:Uncharacterized protein n=1 Tax=Mycolicibacterium fluoranthenivorans TaxID=258505 RepID=A0A7X5U4G3_9MYCO|nr:hypothetical protein [Mycolicibacterium fluoranthenivorans]
MFRLGASGYPRASAAHVSSGIGGWILLCSMYAGSPETAQANLCRAARRPRPGHPRSGPSSRCRGGGIRTHDLFVPNHATWGFDDVGYVGPRKFSQLSCIGWVGARRSRENLLRTACGLRHLVVKAAFDLPRAGTLKSGCQFGRLLDGLATPDHDGSATKDHVCEWTSRSSHSSLPLVVRCSLFLRGGVSYWGPRCFGRPPAGFA